MNLEEKIKKKEEIDVSIYLKKRRIAEELHKKGEQMQEKFHKLVQKREELKKHVDAHHKKVLEGQFEKLSKAKSIENILSQQQANNL